MSELKGNASERREELTARFNELNEKLSELKAKHKRLYKAFPSLKYGRKKAEKSNFKEEVNQRAVGLFLSDGSQTIDKPTHRKNAGK